MEARYWEPPFGQASMMTVRIRASSRARPSLIIQARNRCRMRPPWLCVTNAMLECPAEPGRVLGGKHLGEVIEIRDTSPRQGKPPPPRRGIAEPVDLQALELAVCLPDRAQPVPRCRARPEAVHRHERRTDHAAPSSLQAIP